MGRHFKAPKDGVHSAPNLFLTDFTAAAKREKINARSSRVMKNQRYESEMSVGILRLVGPLSQCTQHTCWKVRCWSFRKCPPPLPLCKRCGHDSREITAMKMQIQYFASHPMSVFAAATGAELFFAVIPIRFLSCSFSYRFCLIKNRSGGIERRAIRFESPTPRRFFSFPDRGRFQDQEGHSHGN